MWNNTLRNVKTDWNVLEKHLENANAMHCAGSLNNCCNHFRIMSLSPNLLQQRRADYRYIKL